MKHLKIGHNGMLHPWGVITVKEINEAKIQLRAHSTGKSTVKKVITKSDTGLVPKLPNRKRKDQIWTLCGRGLQDEGHLF